MNIWDLQKLGFTNHRIRTIIDGCNGGDPKYQWFNETLIYNGTNKPKIDARKFIEGYRQFRVNQLDAELEKSLALLNVLDSEESRV